MKKGYFKKGDANMVQKIKIQTVEELKGFIKELVAKNGLPTINPHTRFKVEIEENLSELVLLAEEDESFGMKRLSEDLKNAGVEYENTIFLTDSELKNKGEMSNIKKIKWNGFHNLDGRTFYGGFVGADFTYPTFIAIYQDVNGDLRAFVPQEGNSINPLNQLPYGMDSDNDDEIAKANGFTDFNDLIHLSPDFETDMYNSEAIEEEILENLVAEASYQLVKRTGRDLERFKVTIVGDSNDADYVTSIETYSKETFEKYVLPGLNHLHNFGSWNDFENYDNLYDLSLPYSDNGRCHSLESVKVEYTDENQVIWDVDINYTDLPYSFKDNEEHLDF